MSLFDFFKRKQAKADKITKVYDKPLPEPTVNPKDNQPSAARYDEATSAWARKMMELEDETDPDVLTELDPDAERAREVRFWIDNMALCVKHNFAPEQYDVGGMLHQLIEEEEYELARELLFCCIDEVRNRPSTPCIDDMLVYFAWICYKDGDGDDEDETDDCEDEDDLEDEESQDDCDETDEDEDCDEDDEDDEYEDDDEIDEDDEYEDDEEIDEDDVTFETEYHNLRSAHELVVAVSDHFTPHWRDTHLWLACLYNECYVNYDDYEIADLPGSHSPNWYGQQAYRYFSKAAEEGQYLAMNMKALFLVMGHQVKPNYDKAYDWFKRSEDHCDESLLWLGHMHYYAQYGRENKRWAISYYMRYIKHRKWEGEGARYMGANYAQASCNLAHLLLHNNSNDDEHRARRLLERVAYFGFTLGDALYGLVLLEGRGGPTDTSKGLRLLHKAANAGDPMAQQMLRFHGY